MFENPFKQSASQRQSNSGGDGEREGGGGRGFRGGRGFGERRGGRGSGSADFVGRRGAGGRGAGRGRGGSGKRGGFGGRGGGRGGRGGSFKRDGFRDNRNSGRDFTQKEENWGKVKFNPVARSAKVESGTPWMKYKSDIVQQQREERNADKVNMDSEEAKQFLKEREENFRRMRIAEKQNEPTKWEDFVDDKAEVADEGDAHKNSKKKKRKMGDVYQNNNAADDSLTKKKKQKVQEKALEDNDDENNGAIKSKKREAKKQEERQDDTAEESSMAAKPKTLKYKDSATSRPEFISKELLNNFDSKKLTFAQKNTLRKAITKTTNLSRGMGLESIVKVMKRKELNRGK